MRGLEILGVNSASAFGFPLRTALRKLKKPSLLEVYIPPRAPSNFYDRLGPRVKRFRGVLTLLGLRVAIRGLRRTIALRKAVPPHAGQALGQVHCANRRSRRTLHTPLARSARTVYGQ